MIRYIFAIIVLKPARVKPLAFEGDAGWWRGGFAVRARREGLRDRRGFE
jgi:hypothetical protein